MLNFKNLNMDQIISFTKYYNQLIEKHAWNVHSYIPHAIMFIPPEGIVWAFEDCVEYFGFTFYKCANFNNFLNVSIHLEDYYEEV